MGKLFTYGQLDPSNRNPWPGNPDENNAEIKKDAWDQLGIELRDSDIRKDDDVPLL
jgi:hypothetical protein